MEHYVCRLFLKLPRICLLVSFLNKRNQYKCNAANIVFVDFSPSSPSKTFPTEGKLEKMENLQYDLTK